MLLFSGTNYQEDAGKQYISQIVEGLVCALTFVQALHYQSLPRCLVPTNPVFARTSSIQGLDGTAEWAVHRSYGFFQTQERI